jgi:hypothetical protein
MCPRGDTQYFLEVERIVLYQHLKETLERAAGLLTEKGKLPPERAIKVTSGF